MNNEDINVTGAVVPTYLAMSAHDGECVGKLYFTKDGFSFEGNADEAAKIFFEALETDWGNILADKDERIAELEQSLKFFMEQSVIIEHKQDREKMNALRKKYGWEW